MIQRETAERGDREAGKIQYADHLCLLGRKRDGSAFGRPEACGTRTRIARNLGLCRRARGKKAKGCRRGRTHLRRMARASRDAPAARRKKALYYAVFQRMERDDGEASA